MECLPRAILMAQVNRLDVYNRQLPQVLCSLHVNNCQMSLTSQSALTLNILEQSYSYQLEYCNTLHIHFETEGNSETIPDFKKLFLNNERNVSRILTLNQLSTHCEVYLRCYVIKAILSKQQCLTITFCINANTST